MSERIASATVSLISSRRRPDVPQVDRLAVGALAKRLLEKVDVHAAGERVGDAERRRGQVVVAHVLLDTPLEVAVARQDRADNQVVVVDRGGDLIGERARVPDARGAAVADEVEAQLVEVLGEAGAIEVVRHDHRPRRKRRLHPGLRLEATLGGLARQQPGRDHDRWVRGVGAARDRRDHDPAVIEVELRRVVERDRNRIGGALSHHGPARLAGLSALVVVILRRRVRGRERFGDRVVVVVAERLRGVRIELAQGLEERRLGVGQRDAVLWALRPGDRGLDLAEVELDRLRERRVLGGLVVEHALLARVGADELDQLGRAAGELEVPERLAVDREDGAGRSELGRHISDRRAVGEPEARKPGAVELDELPDHAALAKHLGDA